MSRKNRVLLTGGTGFIGSHIYEALAGEGCSVRALARSRSDRSHLLSLNAEICDGDIENLGTVCQAIRGCDQVVHAAGLAYDWAPRARYTEVNVIGTLNVLEACKLEGVRSVVMLGSISSYGEEDSQNVKDESFPFNSHYRYFCDGMFPCRMNWYRDSKAEATRQAMTFARTHGIDLSILEPVWVYGEREFNTGFYLYLKAVKNGQRWMPGATRNRFHVIYARDVAKACVLACRLRIPGAERFIIGNPTAEPMHKVFGLFCQEANLPPPRRLPKWSVYPAGVLLECLYTLMQRSKAPLLTRGRINMFYDSIQYSPQKAADVLGFTCDYTVERGIRQTVAWYKSNKYL